MLPVILRAMKSGGYLGAADGFTIVEVMIVLAVSGLLLISAIVLINGRQAKTEFTTGINDELSQIQQIITDTTDGYYPNNGDISCTGNPGVGVVLKSAATKQGTNSGCIYLGSAIQFGLGSTSPNSSTLGVLPIVGNAYQIVGGVKTPVLTVSGSVPRALYPANGTAAESGVPTDAVEQDYMENGLQIANGNNACGLGAGSTAAVCYLPEKIGGSWTATGMAAFVVGDNTGNIAAPAAGSGSYLQSGTPQISLYAVAGSSDDKAFMTASSNVHAFSSFPSQGLDPAKEVLVCVSDYGGGGGSGLFTIGGSSTATSNGGLGVTVQMKGDSTC